MTGPDLAQLAYRAYAESTGGKTWDGRDMPDWDGLGERIQGAWTAAAEEVRAAVVPQFVVPSPTTTMSAGVPLSFAWQPPS